MMRKTVFIIIFLTINTLCLYAQEQQEIFRNVLQSYQKELPILQRAIFRKFRNLNKQGNIHRNDFNKYQIIVIPIFKLNPNFTQYKEGEMFARYIDFKKMWYRFDVYIFKDSTYIGYLWYEKNWSFYLKKHNTDLAEQIRDFKPDMIFYPACTMFICCIKDSKFYISKLMKETSNCVLIPEDELIKKYPLFIKDLKKYQFATLKHYKKFH